MRPKHACILLRWSFLLYIQHTSTALAANYSVVQHPPEVMAIVGDNVTLRCAFSIQAKQATSAKGAMSWFRGSQGAESVVVPGHRFSLAYPDTFLSPGEGRLVITNVSLEDAGYYTCQVMVWGQEETCGNGVKLHVYARPSQPIFLLQLQTEPQSRWTLICRTSGFYPSQVLLTWNHAGLQLPSSQQNCFDPTGSLQASSHLDLPDPDQSASYTCSVEHPSLLKPLEVEYYYVPQHQASLPPSVIAVLNLLKMGTILGIVIGCLTPACINCCRKGSRKPPAGRDTQSQQILQSHTRNAFYR